MNRNICIYQEFLTEAHKDRIRETARRTGFTPHFFNLDQFEEAKDCLQHCEVLYAHSADLLRAAPATLKWYCCSFASSNWSRLKKWGVKPVRRAVSRIRSLWASVRNS